MEFIYKKKDQVTDGVGLLISLLVRYPEVATINFDPEQQILKFKFIVLKTVLEEEMKSLKQQMLDCIEVFNKLQGKTVRFSTVDHQYFDSYTMIEINRDVETLVREEIDLIAALFRQNLENSLVKDDSSGFYEEDIIIQEEIIDHMLEIVKDCAVEKKLFAFREEGKVLVFNK